MPLYKYYNFDMETGKHEDFTNEFSALIKAANDAMQTSEGPNTIQFAATRIIATENEIIGLKAGLTMVGVNENLTRESIANNERIRLESLQILQEAGIQVFKNEKPTY